MFKIILTIGIIQALAVSVQFLKSKIIAVYLGPAGVGVIGTIDQFVQFASFVFVLGMPAASVKFLSKAHSESQEEFKRIYAGFFKVLLFLSVAGAGLTIGIVFFKPGLFGEDFEKYRLFLILGLLTLPAAALSALFVNVFASAQRFKMSSGLTVIINAVGMAATIAGVFAAGVFGIYFFNVIAGILLTIAVMIYFRFKLELPLYDRHIDIRTELQRSPEISRAAIMLYFAAITASVSYLAARYAVFIYFGEVEAGLLHGVLALSFAIGMALYPAVNVYLTPYVNRNVEKNIKIRQAIGFQRKIIFIFSLGALPILMFPQFMLTLMFSEKFAAAGRFVYLFILSQLIVQIASVYQALLVGFDDVKSYSIVTSIGQIISASLCFILVPYFGIKGVAFGFLIGNSFIFLSSLIRLKTRHCFFVSGKLLLIFGFIFTALFLSGFICSQKPEWESGIVLAKISFVILYGGCLFLFLTREEKDYLLVLKNRILGKNIEL